MTNPENYHKLPPFKAFVVTNFPFIEATFDAIDNYQLMCKIVAYIDEVAKNNNHLTTDMINLKGAFTQLKNYVDNYFDNLNVQSEVNVKLDEMAQDGTMTNLIKGYIDPLYDELLISNNAFKGEVNEEIRLFKAGVNETIGEQNTAISDISTSVNAQLDVMDNKINAITSGAPAGVYATVSDLETADPDHDKIYLVSADGHWYYYDITNTEWADGGTYQATEIASDSIQYDQLNNMLKKKTFNEVHAEDILWMTGTNVHLGQYTGNTDYIASAMFILPKGNTITLDETLVGRITVYDMNFAYVTNTGTIGAINNWSYSGNADCIVNITFGVADSTQTDLSLDLITNENIIFTGLSLATEFAKSLKFTLDPDSDTRALSQPFYVSAGTKIGFNANKRTNIGDTKTYPFRYCLLEENNEKSIYNDVNYVNTAITTVTAGKMVRLCVRFRNASIEPYINKLQSDIVLESNYYYDDNTICYAYCDNNASIDVIPSGTHLYIKFNDYVNIKKNTTTIYRFNMSTLASLFPDNIVDVDGTSYFDLANVRILYYDILNNTLKLQQMDTVSIILGANCIPLIVNRAANLCGGLLFELILKYRVKSLENTVASINISNFKNTLDMFNSMPYGTYNWANVAGNFSLLYNGLSTNINSFLFFTDPHIMGSDNTYSEDTLINYLNPLEKVYNSIPAEYLICGGDWLNDGDYQATACFKLGYIDGFMKSKFRNYYPILGNHDTNYQGHVDEESQSYDGRLTNATITNLLFKNFGANYYSFKTSNSTNYVLDTEIDWNDTMNTYKWNQIDWLANKLLVDDPSHSTVFMHIVWVTLTPSETLGSMADPVTKLIEAFNDHTTITLNSISYDFTNCTGHVDYVLSGHTHTDKSDIINNVLCIATRNFGQGTGTYDICINDYDNNKLYMYRVGSGDSREFDI